MRQISIILLSALCLNAAPPTRQSIQENLNNTFLPKVGNLNTFTMAETLEVLHRLSNNKINFLYFGHLTPESPPSVTTNAPPAMGGLPPLPIAGGGIPNQPMIPFPPNGANGLANNNIGMINPATGLPLIPIEPEKPQRQEPVIKSVTGELKNITLKQLVEIVEMTMQPPVQYVITDWGVVFLPRAKNKPYLPTRTFRLNRPHLFRK